MHEAFQTTVDVGGLQTHVTVDPAMAGANDIHLMFMPTEGHSVELAEVTVLARLASKQIGPLRYKARPGGHGAGYVVRGADLSIPGDWQLRIEARRGEFELLTQTVSVPIKEGS